MRILCAFAIVAACALLGTAGRAQALSEICPASASQLNVLDGTSTAKVGTIFSYELDSLSPETVSGTLSIQTSDGWYQVPFGPVQLTGHKEAYTMGQTSFVRNNIFSDPLYVRFSVPVSISRVFVSTITTDDTAFAWPTKTGLECDDTSEGLLIAPAVPPKSSGADVSPVHGSLTAMPAPGASVGLAAKTTLFDSLVCAKPFVSAHAVNSVPPDFPGEAAGFVANSAVKVIVAVAVAIDVNGKVTDDWVVAPGPLEAFNRASIPAAEATTYSPGISRCRAVPGVYLFHTEFSRD